MNPANTNPRPNRLLGALVAAALLAPPSLLSGTAAACATDAPIVSESSLTQLSFIGLPAERLLAAGMTSPQIMSAAQRLRDSAQQLAALDAARQQLVTAQATVKSLKAAADGAGPDAQALAALAAAEGHAAASEQQVAALRAALTAVVLADTSPEIESMLARALLGAKIGIDGGLSLAADSEAAQSQIALALQAESRAIRLGEELDPELAQLLSDARALPQVAAAESRLAAEWQNLAAALSTPPAPPPG